MIDKPGKHLFSISRDRDVSLVVSDPGFPIGGRQPQGATTYHMAIFSENCAKMKTFWPGGTSSEHPLRSATGLGNRLFQENF